MAPVRDGEVEIVLQLTPEAVAAMRRSATGHEVKWGALDYYDADLACAQVRVSAGQAEQLVTWLAASPGVAAAYVRPPN